MVKYNVENLVTFIPYVVTFFVSGLILDLFTTLFIPNLPTLISYVNEIFIVSSNFSNSQKQISETVVIAYYLGECAIGSFGYYLIIRPFLNHNSGD